MNLVVGVADAKASNRPDDVITTHALGSCIGVAVFDATAKAAGMLHFQLPSSEIDKQRAAERPLMYADTGMQVLINELTKLGAQKKRMRVRLAGGAKMFDDQGLFDIGRRNHAAIRKVLWLHGIFIEKEKVGGTEPMTMNLHVDSGAVVVKCSNQLITL